MSIDFSRSMWKLLIYETLKWTKWLMHVDDFHSIFFCLSSDAHHRRADCREWKWPNTQTLIAIKHAHKRTEIEENVLRKETHSRKAGKSSAVAPLRFRLVSTRWFSVIFFIFQNSIFLLFWRSLAFTLHTISLDKFLYIFFLSAALWSRSNAFENARASNTRPLNRKSIRRLFWHPFVFSQFACAERRFVLESSSSCWRCHRFNSQTKTSTQLHYTSETAWEKAKCFRHVHRIFASISNVSKGMFVSCVACSDWAVGGRRNERHTDVAGCFIDVCIVRIGS